MENETPHEATERLDERPASDLCSSARASARDDLQSLVTPLAKSRRLDSARGAPRSFSRLATSLIPKSAFSSHSCRRQGGTGTGSSAEIFDLVAIRASIGKPRVQVNRKTSRNPQSARISVTQSRENMHMEPRPRDPIEEQRIRKPGVLPGVRITYWRGVRGFDIRPTAEKIGIAESSLRELEGGQTRYGKYLHEIAAILGLHYEYLRYGKGPDELDRPPEAQSPDAQPFTWPLPGVSLDRIAALADADISDIQREWLEGKINGLLEQVEADMKGKRGTPRPRTPKDGEAAPPASAPQRRVAERAVRLPGPVKRRRSD